jgi:hypothetical protein
MSTSTFVLAARTGELAGQTRKERPWHCTERISAHLGFCLSGRRSLRDECQPRRVQSRLEIRGIWAVATN